MKIKIINKSGKEAPQYSTVQSAGMDIRACIDENITLNPLERKAIPTALYIELPKGFEAQIRPRSGMALQYGITVLNSPGTIDADYRGEIKVILVNLSDEKYIIKNGERIAQMVIVKHERVEWEECENLKESERGSGGFGSTGKN